MLIWVLIGVVELVGSTVYSLSSGFDATSVVLFLLGILWFAFLWWHAPQR
jgi:hypothetical protein